MNLFRWGVSYGIHAVVLSVMLVACKDVTAPQSDTANWNSNSPSVLGSSGEEAVSWQNNVLEFEDEDGTPLRMVRDSENATTVRLYENHTLVAVLDLTRSGAEVTSMRFQDASTSAWMRTTAETEPVILATSAGGRCPPGGCIYPESVPNAIDDCDDEYASAQFDCGALGIAAAGAAGAAVASGILTVATIKTPIGLWGVRQTFRATVAAAGAGSAYVACLYMT